MCLFIFKSLKGFSRRKLLGLVNNVFWKIHLRFKDYLDLNSFYFTSLSYRNNFKIKNKIPLVIDNSFLSSSE